MMDVWDQETRETDQDQISLSRDDVWAAVYIANMTLRYNMQPTTHFYIYIHSFFGALEYLICGYPLRDIDSLRSQVSDSQGHRQAANKQGNQRSVSGILHLPDGQQKARQLKVHWSEYFVLRKISVSFGKYLTAIYTTSLITNIPLGTRQKKPSIYRS